MKPTPEVSAVASWVDNFKLPLREIKAKYTKSDLTILAWHSRLQSFNLSLGMKTTRTTSSETAKTGAEADIVFPVGITETEEAYYLPKGVNNGVPIKKKFFDAEGEIDLSKVTGDEAAGYLRALGLPLAIVTNRRKK